MENNEERRILLNLAAGRVNIRASPYSLTRLDRHIKLIHTELSVVERLTVLQVAKRKATLK